MKVCAFVLYRTPRFTCPQPTKYKPAGLPFAENPNPDTFLKFPLDGMEALDTHIVSVSIQLRIFVDIAIVRKLFFPKLEAASVVAERRAAVELKSKPRATALIALG